MPRYKMIVEYDGTSYVGWQIQDNGHSVQAALQKAILKLTGETVSVRGAGRTDSGVHAWGQTVHTDLSREWVPYKLRNAVNAYLMTASEKVSVIDVSLVDETFDARFS
ncbi:MAG: tRNA pseudouridine synthase A, partial [Oxalobacteraceae bacterium]